MKAILFMAATGASWVLVGAAVKAIGRRDLSLALYQAFMAIIVFAAAAATAAANPLAAALPEGVGTGVWAGVVAGAFSYGLFNCAMLHFMDRAMRRGPSSLVWAIVQSGFIYPFLMAWLVFGEPLGVGKVAGIMLILASVALYARGRGTGEIRRAGVSKGNGDWIAAALLGMLFCGINQCGGSLPSHLPRGNEFPPVFRNVLTAAGILCGNIPALVREAKCEGLRHLFRGVSTVLGLALLCQGVAYFANVFLLFPGLDMLEERGMASIGFPVAVTSCIVFFFPYGRFVLRERISPLQALGGVVGIAGIAACCL